MAALNSAQRKRALASLARASTRLLLATMLAASFVSCSPLAAQPRHQQQSSLDSPTTVAAAQNSTLPSANQRPDDGASFVDILATPVVASNENLELGESGYLPSVFYQGGGPPIHEPSYSSGGYTGGGGGYQTGGYSTYGDSQPKSDYANKASDWSLYDQGAHGLHDKYGDKAWTDSGYQSHASHGKRDSQSNVQNSHGSDQGSGYYSRDRGYGFERQYAFDRVIDSKSHSNNHQQYANSRGLYDQYGAKNDHNFNKSGHDKYGLANKYGHGYRQLGSHDDYAHGHSAPAANYPPPLYKSNYYSGVQYPQMPSYY